MELVHKRLKEARVKSGYSSARSFAKIHSISDSTYTQHESGKRKMGLSTLIHYSNLLNTSAFWMITGLVSNEKEFLPSLYIFSDKQDSLENSSYKINLELLTKIYFLLTVKYKELEVQYSILLNTTLVIYNSIANNHLLLSNSTELNQIIDDKFIKYTPLAKYRN